ncbi:hypothetical protein PFISCL1PPCAC_22160, partial [Pristionchus fissidentatus]
SNEFRDALLQVVEKYDDNQTSLALETPTSRSTTPTTFLSSSTAPPTISMPALPPTPTPAFDWRDFTIPQAVDSKHERLGVSTRGMELLPPLYRVLRTAPTLEPQPLVGGSSSSFDDILQVTAEMVVNPVE